MDQGKLLAAALRGVVAELEQDPDAARAALALLLGAPAPSATLTASPAAPHVDDSADDSAGRRLEPLRRARAEEDDDEAVADRDRKPPKRTAKKKTRGGRRREPEPEAPRAPSRWGVKRRRGESVEARPAADDQAVEVQDDEHVEVELVVEGRVVDPSAPAPEPAATTEAARLVAQLVAAHGDLDTVHERFGIPLAALERLAGGGPCSPSALARLQAAAASPAPEGQKESAAPDQDAAGEDSAA